MSDIPKDAMLHCQVSNQLSSLSISKESNGSSALPMYVSTQDLKLGLTTFWRSPYGTGSRKREFPTVIPLKKCNEDSRLPKSNTPSDFNIDKEKNCEPMEPVREDSDHSRNKLRRTLRRSNSFTGDMCSSRMKRREQFSRNKSVCFSSNVVSEKPEVVESVSTVAIEDKSVPMIESTVNLRDNTNTPHSSSAVGSATERSITSNSADVKSSTGARPVSRIPRLTRSFSQTPTKDSPSAEHKANSRGVCRTQSMIRSTPSVRPKTCAGIRSAILPDHTNFCNREKTVRILKWLQEVDDKQTKEGKCMDLSSNLSVTIRKDM